MQVVLKDYTTANNSSCTVTSADDTCTRIVAFIKAEYPQVKYVKFKRSGKWRILRGQWKRRKLYAHGYTPEYAMSLFLLEILRKVFTERLMTPEEYHARRQELKYIV
jgi:hypothetical protein